MCRKIKNVSFSNYFNYLNLLPDFPKGLKQNKDSKAETDEYLAWAEKIGKSRIEHIVSNKHRRAYKRAAQVLGSLAEAYLTMEQKSKAAKILHKYYNEKYNRFSAFRREVKTVVKDPELLRNTCLILR